MSNTIDEKVVEMKFDNKNFESNVKESLSTLDKLKEKLNFKGASQGLGSVQTAASKTSASVSNMSKSVDTVQAKFSALQVMGITSLANITTAAMNYGNKIASALTLDPVLDGFREYETQMGAVQTILANTQSKGSTLKDVNAALDELNTYADQTIYNFTEMTRNIGTFTAAGVDLDKSVTSIKGIANLAAVSGSTSQQASTAMYQLSQALAAGKVQLQDWNSVVNAGMGGEVFQNALKRTATQMGTNVDALIKKYGSFRESLTKGNWLTAEVLTETLTQLSGAYSESDLIAQGYTEKQAKEIVKLAKTALHAATDVKTFTQLLDTLKEALGSGWTKTWQLIIGDFEEAKELWTGISDFLGGIIQKSADARNKFLASALYKDFTKLGEKVKGLLEPAKKAVDTVNNVKTSLDDLGKVVDNVILGKFGNGKTRFDALVKAGVNYYEVQNKVNEKLGDSYRHSQKKIDELNEKLKNQKTTTSNAKDETVKLTKAQREQLTALTKLSDEQLKAKGYTDEQIKALRELRDTADKLGMSVGSFLKNMDKINGRWLIIDSFKKIATSIIKIFNTIGKAYHNVFESLKPRQLFDAIAAFHKFTSSLIISDDTADKLRRTFEGLFSIVKIVTTITGGALKFAFDLLSSALGAVDLDILSVTASIGDMIVGFKNWLLSDSVLAKGFELASEGIKKLVEFFKQLFDTFSNMPQVVEFLQNAYSVLGDLSKSFSESIENLRSGAKSVGEVFSDVKNAISDAFKNIFGGQYIDDLKEVLSSIIDTIKGWLSNLANGGDYSSVGANIIEGLVNGLSDGAGKVLEAIINIGIQLLESIRGVLGIHSPSTEFFEIGQNIIQGLINGLASMLSPLWEFIKGIGQGIIDVFNELDWGVVLTTIAGVGAFAIFYKIAKAMETFANAAKAFTAPCASVAKFIDTLSGAVANLGKSLSAKIKADAVKSIAISIAILAGSIFLLAQLDVLKAWNAVGIIVALSAVLAALTYGLGKINAKAEALDAAKLAGIMLSLGTALILFAATMKIISGMSWEDLGKAGLGIAGMAVVIAALVYITKKAGTEEQITKATEMIGKVALAFVAMAVAAKIIGSMSWEDLGKAGAGIVVMTGIIVGLMAATRLASDKELAAIGSTILAVAGAITMLAIVGRIIAGMSLEEMGKAAAGILFLSGIIVGLVAATRLASDKDLAKVGVTILAVAGAMALLAITARMISGMSVEGMVKAYVGINYLAVIIIGLMAATRLANGEKLARVGLTILAMSAAIAILAGVCVLLGLVKPENLVKGILAVGALSVMVGIMVAMTKNAKDVKGTMIGIAVAIGVMAGAIALLSFIDPANLTKAVVALSIVMGMFALVELASESVTESFKTLIVMTVAIGMIAGALTLLSAIAPDQALQSALAMSVVLLALSGSMKILDNVGEISKTAIKSMASLLLIVAGIAVILGVMSALNAETSLANALTLSAMLLAISGVCVILSTIQTVSKDALIAMGVLTGIVAALAVVLGILTALNVAPSIETAAALSLMLLSMSVAVGILGAIAPLATAAIEGAAALVAVVGVLSAAIIAFGAISQIPGVDWLVSEGGEFLQKIGTAIGQFVGGIAGGAAEGATSTLPQVGSNLSDFMTNLKPFIDGAKNLDSSVLESIKNLALAILVLTGANLVESITNFISGGSSLSDFANQLVPLGEAMMSFSKTVTGIDTEAVESSAKAAKALAELGNSLPKEGGLAQAIFGETTDFATFGTQLVSFGKAISSYSKTVADIDAGPIEASAKAGKALSELASSLPKEGGLSQAVFGETTDFGTFGTQLVSFGKAISSYSKSVVDLETDPITKSVTAAKAIVKLANSLPDDPGWIQNIFGGQDDLSGFGDKLKSFGEALCKYSGSISEIDIGKMDSSIQAAEKLKSLAESLKDFDSSGFDNFKIADLGTKLKDYSNKTNEINSEGVSSSISTIKSLIKTINSMKSIDTSGIDKFKEAVNSLSEIDMNSLSQKLNGSSSNFSSIGSALISSLVSGFSGGGANFVSTVGSIITSGSNTASSKTGAFRSAGSSAGGGLKSGISSSGNQIPAVIAKFMSSASNNVTSKNGAFRSGGLQLSNSLKTGISNGSKGAVSATKTMANNCAKASGSKNDSFKNYGVAAASGFARGISSMAKSAINNARSMAENAASAVKSALKINSPSKVFRKIGTSVPEGFAQGIGKLGHLIRHSSVKMAKTAVSGTENALAQLSLAVDSMDVNAQPVITPVLDMTNVNGVLDQGLAIGTSMNLNSISASMRRRAQNGTNAEVVSAIDKLRSEVRDLEKPSYNINGITYDNGSQISEAIETLVRAAIVERRV